MPLGGSSQQARLGRVAYLVDAQPAESGGGPGELYRDSVYPNGCFGMLGLAIEAGLDLARQRLADAVLLSPIDGVVLERRTDVGERLSEGTVTFVVVQTAPLKLRFRVPERYLGAAEKGAKVRATVDPYPGERFEGTVSVVVGAMDPASRTFAVEALFANRDGRLRPGLFARVELELGPARK